jgi:molybdate transport system substrate-binding protein
MATEFAVIGAGAAKGLVESLQPGFEAAQGVELRGVFGAVGAMQERLTAGERYDAVILTAPMIALLEGRGDVVAGSTVALGRVRTGIAVPAAAARPPIGDRASLLATLRAASSLYVPDTERSTAGRHVLEVLRRLGIEQELAPRLRRFANGAAAMRELALAADASPLGCTQVSEILYTPGVALAGALPPEFELATTYAVAVAATARRPELARRFAALLGAAESRALRQGAGFEA